LRIEKVTTRRVQCAWYRFEEIKRLEVGRITQQGARARVGAAFARVRIVRGRIFSQNILELRSGVKAAATGAELDTAGQCAVRVFKKVFADEARARFVLLVVFGAIVHAPHTQVQDGRGKEKQIGHKFRNNNRISERLVERAIVIRLERIDNAGRGKHAACTEIE
jgi:hypothetical protein